MDGGLVGKKE